MNGIKYTTNSCYIDCVLMSLAICKQNVFELKTNSIKNSRLKEQLTHIYNYIHGYNTVFYNIDSLREILKLYESKPYFSSLDPGDPMEFVDFLRTHFAIDKKFNVFSLPRGYNNNGKEYLNLQEMKPKEKLGSEKLVSIIVYAQFHYTCYLIYNGVDWGFYNDYVNNIVHIGSYKNMIESFPSPTHRGYVFFYLKE